LWTLADARAYILSLPEGEQLENRWQHAAKLLLEACETGDADAATQQVEFALFMGARLALQSA
jgi:hypothetical protein